MQKRVKTQLILLVGLQRNKKKIFMPLQRQTKKIRKKELKLFPVKLIYLNYLFETLS